MAKEQFQIRNDLRLGGQHLTAGSTITLDPEDAEDAKVLSDLKASNRIVLPKRTFKLRQDVTIDGNVLKAGSNVELFPEDPADARTFAYLQANNAIADEVLAEPLAGPVPSARQIASKAAADSATPGELTPDKAQAQTAPQSWKQKKSGNPASAQPPS